MSLLIVNWSLINNFVLLSWKLPLSYYLYLCKCLWHNRVVWGFLWCGLNAGVEAFLQPNWEILISSHVLNAFSKVSGLGCVFFSLRGRSHRLLSEEYSWLTEGECFSLPAFCAHVLPVPKRPRYIMWSGDRVKSMDCDMVNLPHVSNGGTCVLGIGKETTSMNRTVGSSICLAVVGTHWQDFFHLRWGITC